MLTTPEEWKGYIDRLSGETLLRKAQAANSMKFVRTLLDEGFEADEIENILLMFCRRIARTGQVPLPGGYLSLSQMIRDDDQCQKQMNKEVILEDSFDPDEGQPDNLDEMFDQIDMEAEWEEEDLLAEEEDLLAEEVLEDAWEMLGEDEGDLDED